ncbi:ATP-binding protein [Marinoscillum sp.]|uniref:ATP-binding protein n=1 Tax=Marinoscillum sp. TaxID=2024838 RepID=UPI003BAC2968
MLRLTLYIVLATGITLINAQSWEQAKATGEATLNLAWYTSRPFVEKKEGKMVGMEAEMLEEFKEFVRDKYKVELTLNWFEDTNFPAIMERVKASEQPNVFGISAFSITKKRAEVMKFTDPYMPDITVLVSSQGTPIVRTFEEIDDFMEGKEAVTIKSTTYEQMLFELKDQLGVDFDIKYIPSGQNILEEIARADNRFGFIDLPIYLMLIKRGGDLTRQNFFTIKGDGYGIIMPVHSDWDEPFNEFLKDPKYADLVSESISKYLGRELYDFIDRVYESDQLSTSILTKEKELQLELIKNANLKLQEEQGYRQLLIIGIIITTVFIVVLIFLYINNRRVQRELSRQKSQIESHQKAIAIKNEQLTNRNRQLININEEKNNLVNILAHDMRSPLGQIIGLTSALEAQLSELDQDQAEMLVQMSKSTQRLNQMINKMLDENALEKHHILQEPVYVSHLLNDIVKRYRSVAAPKQISIDLHPCEEQYLITTDHLLLLQVLENLVSNAVKFSPQNSVVTVAADCHEDKVVFSVQDEGPGFSTEDKELMFGRFQKLSAKPTGGETSTGLGLSIVKKYINQLNGDLELISESGRGARFLITIPKG